MKSWNLDSLPWHRFDSSKVDPRLLAQAKGAALVESNAADYVSYLEQVFADDNEILTDIHQWGEEEKLHGAALRRWCEMADPTYDYEVAMKTFLQSYRIPLHVDGSTRGSRARELVARCVVETGTTTFYTAMRDSAEEPVLKEICRCIAGDEVRHFNLFLKHLNRRYAGEEQLGFLGRLKTIKERVTEVNDPELTFAYFAANDGENFDPSKFPEYSRKYMGEIAEIYRPKHFQSTVPMLSKAAGLATKPWISSSVGKAVHTIFQRRYRISATLRQ